ncbi:MAG: FAD-dependent oxidoreductase [Actinophytocola sp.]|uniref:NAD(P)/FAD-dependent oxidoreductase n=1 Tax=Actinophytocola sp. TaxID=1872138 RepID=UPI0013263937|nr:NAD(P)/FAD-dependent oxidoreductase [Actinophytocola sp.]MPZ81300.1 FAD-dependent oxidoreductase [Actinophytocola sp.]
MRDVQDEYDVVVVGGGPAGSVSAGLLALRGHRVLVIEREKFPRYHIGESLTTGSLPALDDLGLRDRVNELGFTKKYGGSLLWGTDEGVWDFRFAEAHKFDYSFQVRRADFDALLMTRARELGADVIEEATVTEPVLDGDRIVGVTYKLKGDDTPCTVRSKMLIDASGQAKFLGRQFDLVDWHEDLRNIAVWTYFQGHTTYEGTRAGDTLSEARPNGWLWYIPLSDNTASIGYVTHVAELKKSGLTTRELFERELADSQEVRQLTEGAWRVSGFRTARDWSYTSNRFHGPGWALLGDAAAFVDPLMSAGVAMALRAARGLAASIDWVLQHPDDEAKVMSQYDGDYRKFAGDLLSFIRFFYDRTRNKEDYYAKAQRTVGPGNNAPSKQNFALILSGMAGLHEVFTGPKDLAAAGSVRPKAEWHYFN